MNIMDANPIRRGLKQLQKDDQAARVKELKRKQLQFYKKQKVCETFSTISIISTFGCKYTILHFTYFLYIRVHWIFLSYI